MLQCAIFLNVSVPILASMASVMKHRGKTPPFRRPDGNVMPGSIAEIAYLHLGGIDQWVMIRGESISNPVLILLHGGPGFPEVRLFRTFKAPLEKSFTVVYWEQRGTNKSFDRRIPRSSIDGRAIRFRSRRTGRYGAQALPQKQSHNLRAFLGLGAWRALCSTFRRKSGGLCRHRADRRLSYKRAGIL